MVEIVIFHGEHLTPGLYKMAGTAERESSGPQTPPSKIQSRQSAISPEHNDCGEMGVGTS